MERMYRKLVGIYRQAPMPILGYAAATAGFSVISHVFGFYYVKVFLEHYHIQQDWFQFSQVLYMIWNTINDPLFGYFQDKGYFKFLETRRSAVFISAPLWALSFLMAWFPWETNFPSTWVTGVHLVTTLCLYDTMFTFLGLILCALFTEISEQPSLRVRLLRWSKIGNIIAAGFVFSCEYMSESLKVFWKFQVVCIVVALTSMSLLRFASQHSVTEYEKKGVVRSQDNITESIWRLTFNILTNRNFVAFVVVNFCHEFHGTFLYNFMAIICENLIPLSSVSLSLRSVMYFVHGLLPCMIIIFGAPLIQSIGYYRLVRLNFAFKFTLAVILYLVGRHHGWVLIVVMVLDGGVSAAAYGLYNLALADIADEDKAIYGRELPNSSMVFGTNALVMKSVYSLAPMIVVAILNRYGYGKLKDQMTESEKSVLHDVMFNLVCFLPIIVAIIQTISWSFYKLRTTHKIQHIQSDNL